MPRATPLDRVHSLLEGRMPQEALDRLPQGYERVGDVLVLEGPLPGPEDVVASAYAHVLGARSVLAREGRIEGELRRPSHRRVWGDADTRTLHRENGVRYRIDPLRVMWSAGNRRERERVASWDCRDETVVDLFAGVGYFSIPVALRTGARRVVAIEKNPVSASFLRDNVALNGVADKVEVLEGDCREVAPEYAADRVLMGYLPDALPFLPTALRTLRERGRVLLHRVVGPRGLDAARAEAVRAVEEGGARVTAVDAHVVKSYGPRTVHAVFEVEIER